MKSKEHAQCSPLATPRAKTHKSFPPMQLTPISGETRADRLERRFRKEYAALVNRVMTGEQLQARMLIGHDSQLNRAELAERASREVAQQQAEQAGMPHRMNSEQGLRSLRAALGGC
ncbi:hypothetical protein ACM25P_07280 [Vreelandella alkaliphila]|uniref:hypothetical protein n=1 Tax=Vreelandella alkaliphila TaxID=272774 RepID=UPI0039F53981